MITILAIITIIILFIYNNYQIEENFTNDEAVKNIASLYNQSKLAVTDFTSTGTANLNTAKVAGISTFKGNATGGTYLPWQDGNNYITSNNNVLRGGPTTIQGNLNANNNATIGGDLIIGANLKSGGRMHINPGEILFLLPKNGAIVSKAWGGTGDLTVEGNTITSGNVTNNGPIKNNNRMTFRTIRNAKPQDGWDIGNWTGVGDVNVCAQQCASKYNTALQASVYKPEGRCFCKATPSLNGNGMDNNWDTVIMI